MRDHVPALIALVVGLGMIVTGAMGSNAREAARGPKDRDQLTEECDDGKARSCYDLGIAWGTGKDGPSDQTEARKWVQRACDLGDSEACDFLPQMAE